MCYVRQCLTSGEFLYQLVKGASGANMISDMSYKSRGKFTTYVNVCIYLWVHCNTQLLIFRFSFLCNT